MNKLLSIIIPVYNVEEYLNECIDSLLPQCDDRCEIILVNDGSTDRCREICDRYKAESHIVKVIHKENGGPGPARNSGINEADGKYIIFIDADDRIYNHSIIRILEWCETNDTDFCFLDAIKFYKDGRIEYMNDGITSKCICNKSKLEVIKFLSSRPKFSGSPCTKIYRRELLIKNNIRFPNDRRLAEDLGFVRDTIYFAGSYDSLNFDYYQYRQDRENSNTSVFAEKSINGLHLFIIESIELLCENNKPKDYICRYMMSFAAYEYAVLMFNVASSKLNDFEFLEKYRWVLKYANELKLKIIHISSLLLGINNTIKMVYRIKK